MKSRRILSAAVCVAMMVSAGSALATTYVKSTANVRIRSKASTNSAVLGTLNKGDTLEYGGKTSDGRWLKVYYNGTVGYVSNDYAGLTNIGSTSGNSSGTEKYMDYDYVRATGNANLRKGPGKGYQSVNVIYEGDVAKCLGIKQKDSRGVYWYKVKYDGKTCWISSVYGKLTNNGTPLGYEYVTATDGSTYIRASWDKYSEILDTLSEGDSAHFMGKIRTDYRGVDWYQVKYDGKVGWVSEKYTTLYN